MIRDSHAADAQPATGPLREIQVLQAELALESEELTRSQAELARSQAELARSQAELSRTRDAEVADLRVLNQELEAHVVARTAALSDANRELERQLEERKRFEADGEDARGLESTGRLAGGIAHDFNDLLTIIHLELGLLNRRIAGDPALQSHVDQLTAASTRARALTGKLLSSAHREAVGPEVLDFNAVLAEAKPLLTRLVPERIKLVLSPSQQPAWLCADRAGLELVLLNLVVNARNAIPDRGRIELSVSHVEIDDERAQRIRDARPDCVRDVRPGNFICLAVGDDGCGMSREELTQIFEPSETTGGLGLIHGIVTAASGFFAVDSSTSRGTVFRFFLPEVEIPAVAGRASATARGDSETVLDIDDEPRVRNAAVRSRQHDGYVVPEDDSSAEALARRAAHPAIDV